MFRAVMSTLARSADRLVLPLFASFAAFCFACAGPRAPEDPPAETLRAERLDELRAEWTVAARAEPSLGWIALVQHRGRAVLHESDWNESFWTTQPVKEMDGVEIPPYRPDTIFPIGSLTMPITCAVTLTFVEEGRLSLDDPLSKYLPEFESLEVCEFQASGGIFETRPATTQIRIVDLLAHTSGLSSARYGIGVGMLRRRYEEALSEHRGQSTRDRARLLATLPLAFEPGSEWAYGESTFVLGVLLEVIEGRTLQEIFTERIFDPLGMSDTGFAISSEKLHRAAPRVGTVCLGTATPSYFVLPHRMLLDDPPAPPTRCLGGSGLYSTVSDYARFAEMLAGGGERNGVRILTEESVRLMTTDHIGGLPRADCPPELGFDGDSGFGLGVALEIRDEAADGSSLAIHWGRFFVDPELELIGVLYGAGSAFNLRDGVYEALP